MHCRWRDRLFILLFLSDVFRVARGHGAITDHTVEILRPRYEVHNEPLYFSWMLLVLREASHRGGTYGKQEEICMDTFALGGSLSVCSLHYICHLQADF